MKRTNISMIIRMILSMLFGFVAGCDDSDEPVGPSGADTSDANAEACADAMTMEECEAMETEGCGAKYGRKVDIEGNCASAEETLVECILVSEETFCGAAETFALDPENGECYWFPDTCLPDGWTEVERDDCGITSSELCAE